MESAQSEGEQAQARSEFRDGPNAFDDPDAVVNHDRIEGGERRWQTLGMVDGVLLLLVAHTVEFEGEEAEIIRIISARRADRKEKQRYEKERQKSHGW